jgi:hypothetical protein
VAEIYRRVLKRPRHPIDGGAHGLVGRAGGADGFSGCMG